MGDDLKFEHYSLEGLEKELKYITQDSYLDTTVDSLLS